MDFHRLREASLYVSKFSGIAAFTILFLVSAVSYYGFTYGEENAAYSLVVSRLRYLAYFLVLVAIFFDRNFKSSISSIVLFLAFGAYVVFSAIWSEYPIKILTNSVHYFGAGLAAYFTVKFLILGGRSLAIIYWVFLSVLIVIASFLEIILYPEFAYFIQESEAEAAYSFMDGRLAGVSGSPNTLGVVALLSIWACVSGMHYFNSRLAMTVLVGGAVLGCVVLYMTSSATSIISTAILISVLILNFRFLSINRKKKNKTYLTLLYVALLVGAVTLSTFSDKVTFSNFAEGMGKDTTLTGRTDIWEDATVMFAQKPIEGWGFDNRTAVGEESPLEFIHYHNGFLDLAVRGGAVGSIIFFVMYVGSTLSYYKLSSSKRRELVPFFSLLLVTFIYNITEVTFASWINLFWLASLFSIFYINEYVLIHRSVASKRTRRSVTQWRRRTNRFTLNEKDGDKLRRRKKRKKKVLPGEEGSHSGRHHSVKRERSRTRRRRTTKPGS